MGIMDTELPKIRFLMDISCDVYAIIRHPPSYAVSSMKVKSSRTQTQLTLLPVSLRMYVAAHLNLDRIHKCTLFDQKL